MTTTTQRLNPLHVLAAFLSGGLLTLMVLFNGQLAHYGNPLFSSWAAHGTGTVAAIIMLAVLYRRPRAPTTAGKAPLWAYLGGISGALTVILTSTTVNSALALSGTLALGLAGQVVFSLAADRWGLFGMPRRRPTTRDMAALALIVAGSALIILFGRGA
ncbi:DMT family transporter [Devosia neptuniae]|jgi:transporter family-2 protein|uniref:DMT family transporter n=1 Tax=Devosia TaxID=46913 RepID=UPI0022B039EB|nr:DMT family transporter [Devosia neptuniae]MCZ4347082.1 DMT family transporter [Devosia neptuniae]|tara:strand:+ start:1595 stop:2071 length:477 start_codon:yes stop_codon:yes gene_type:complete